MKIKKLDHVVIATADLEDALASWEKTVGLKPDASLDQPLGAGFKVARLPIGESFLELVQPVAKKAASTSSSRSAARACSPISLEVDDLDEAVAHLRSKGAKVSDPEASIWPGARLARINQSSTPRRLDSADRAYVGAAPSAELTAAAAAALGGDVAMDNSRIIPARRLPSAMTARTQAEDHHRQARPRRARPRRQGRRARPA